LTSRVLKPAANAVGVPWVSFHSFRHTCATILFREGWNAVQVQRFLGHSEPGFTQRVYVHLLDEDLPDPSDAFGGGKVAARQAETGRDAGEAEEAISLQGADGPRRAETA
jgi:Phage integrase family